MKAALVLLLVAVLLVLAGNWMRREARVLHVDRDPNWEHGAMVVYFLAAVFGLVALLRLLS